MSIAEKTILLRTLIAALLGLVIGWERLAVGAPVRGRTITLATMTAATLTAVGTEIYPREASRIVAGIITGIGFLGAGLIIRESTGQVRGQATAAALWTMSGIGIIVGSGQLVLGVILTFISYIIMAWDEWPIVVRLKRQVTKRKVKEEENQQRDETKQY